MNLMALFRRRNSAPVARERLQVLLAHERAFVGQSDLLAILQEEIIAVIAKHVSIERTACRSSWIAVIHSPPGDRCGSAKRCGCSRIEGNAGGAAGDGDLTPEPKRSSAAQQEIPRARMQAATETTEAVCHRR